MPLSAVPKYYELCGQTGRSIGIQQDSSSIRPFENTSLAKDNLWLVEIGARNQEDGLDGEPVCGGLLDENLGLLSQGQRRQRRQQ
jgi:hypothetical protein